MTNNIRVIFILPEDCANDTECSEEMQQAFMICKENSMNVKWIKDDKIPNEKWKKTDVLVFQKFEGKQFEEMKSTSSVRIVGPWCMLTCVTEGNSIPNVPWPVFNVAMINCHVTCSNLKKDQKKNIQNIVHSMGGHYSDNLMDVTTHLITDSVKSEKYIKAAERGLKIMRPPWVTEVWNASCKSIVNCNDDQFDQYRCPPFQNLVICCTGFTKTSERNKIQELINTNGGTYKGQLQINSTDILICEKGSTSSAKYKAAKKSESVKCVSYDWLTSSIEKGYALPDHLFPVKIGTSTPTKDNGDGLPDFSLISNITSTSVLGINANTLADTLNVNNTRNIAPNANSSETKKRKSTSNEWDDLVDKIDLKKAKKAGTFLDGCSVFLIGFSSEQKDKLCKVLNFGGAVRYDDISERITHAVVGDPSCHDIKVIHNRGLQNQFPLLNIRWLIDSIEERHPVSEENYLVNVDVNDITEPGSPLSKKGLYVLRSTTPTSKQPEELKQVDKDPQIDNDLELLQQYLPTESSRQDTLAQLLKNASGTFQSKGGNDTMSAKVKNLKNDSVTSRYNSERDDDSASTLTTTSLPFDKMRFMLSELPDDVYIDINERIVECGGSTVPESFKGVPNYVVVPMFIPFLKTKYPCEVVSTLYIEECDQTKYLKDIDYYHRPIVIDVDTKPLSGKVVSISGYSGYERLFLNQLIEELGGIAQQQFARITCDSKGVKGCTHLISSEASGKKYEAALKWNLPVVNKDWLIRCAEKGQLEPEKFYWLNNMQEIERRNSTGGNTNVVCATPMANGTRNTEKGCPKGSVEVPEENTKVETPVKPASRKNSVSTPINKNKLLSQVTPVSKIMEEVRMTNLLGTPECPETPKPWNYVSTPDTPLGAFIRPNPSPSLRKEMAQWINALPDWQTPPQRRPSTPLSELKRQLWNKILPSSREIPSQPDFQPDSSQDQGKENVEFMSPNKNKISPSSDGTLRETPESRLIKNQLQQIQAMLTSSGSKNNSKRRESTIPESVPAGRVKDSQTNTIGWDDSMDGAFGNFTETTKNSSPVIMLSGIQHDEREYMIKQLENLGAIVSNVANYDPKSTHLVCSQPVRNEKILACMASGKWILHTSYVNECVRAGKLVNEEPFEYGNPKSKDNPNIPKDKDVEARTEAIHWWRREISRRGYGPFHDMRAIIVANKKEPLARVIEAGGGVVVEASPPFLEPVHATHCLLEPRSVSDFGCYIPLAEQGIYCLSTLYISEFLQRTASDVRNSLLPYFGKYYTNSFRE